MLGYNKNVLVSKLRNVLFPIQNNEIKKFLPMVGLLFFTIFNLTGMRNIKDVLILSAPGSGAEVLPFLKLSIMPWVVIFSIIYVKLNKSLGFRKTYFVVVSMFLAALGLFTFVLYPYCEYLHPTVSSIEVWKASYPAFQWIISMCGIWVFCLYYLFAELWSTFCLSVLFWQFANNSVTTAESRRFYPLFILMGNFAPILFDQAVKMLSAYSEYDMFKYLNISFLLSGLLLIILFWWVNHYVLIDATKKQQLVRKKKKVALSIWQSFQRVFQSNYIAYIAVLVLCYGVLINIIEVSWKGQVRELYPSAKQQLVFFSGYYRWLAIVTIGLNYLGKGLINRFGWLVGAMATPLIVAMFGGIFFLCVLSIGQLDWVLVYLNYTALEFIVGVGTIGVILSKSAKYSFFDPSKEMVYIPLDKDLSTTGKAAVDGVGGRLGKSGGAVLQVIMLVLTGVRSVLQVANKLVYIVLGLSVMWMWSVTRLHKLYTELLAQKAVQQ